MRFKNKISYLLVIFFGLLITMPVFAQKDTQAKEILDKTSAALNKAGAMSASFSLNIKDEKNKIQHSFEGQMFLKGEKFYFNTPEQAIYFDGKTQWVYQKTIEEVSILEPQPHDIQSLNPISIFETYRNTGDYRFNGEKTDIHKRKVLEISLFPKDKNDEIKQVDVQINPVDYMPVSFHIIFKNNLENRIYISKYQTKLNLSDSQFVFDKRKFPQVEINDLR